MGYDRIGMLRAVRSSDWFAKANLLNEELMKSRQQTLGGEITRPPSHDEEKLARENAQSVR